MTRKSYKLPARTGQALLEYILVMLIVIGLIGILAGGLQGTLRGFQTFLYKQITPACPGCSP